MICFVCSLSSGNRSGVSFAVVVTVLAMVAQVVASLCRRIFVVLALTIVAVHPKYAVPYQVPVFLLMLASICYCCCLLQLLLPMSTGFDVFPPQPASFPAILISPATTAEGAFGTAKY